MALLHRYSALGALLWAVGTAGCSSATRSSGGSPGGPNAGLPGAGEPGPGQSGTGGNGSALNPLQPPQGMGGGLPLGTGGAAAATACTDPTAISPGDSPLRRLNHTEYDNTVQDLLGVVDAPARAFPLEERFYGFDNNASLRGSSLILIELYEGAAQSLATAGAMKIPALAGCDPATAGEDACATQLITTVGERAYRRPLSAEESSRLQAFYTSAKATHGFSAATQMVMAAMLQAPQFLYRMETAATAGPAVAAAPGLVESGQFERASRLSYLLTQSLPDPELLAAAARNELSTKEQIAAQARRLLQLPRARGNVVSFHSQWLDFFAMGQLVKDATLFPTFNPTIASLMRSEADVFIERTVFDGPGTLGALLTAGQSYMNDTLASFYGIAPPGSADALVPVALPPAERAGVLTLAGLLAGHSDSTQGSPVTRGFFVRDALFCQTPPPPPTNLNITVPPFDPALTTRERFAAHSSDPTCGGCHVLMDPIGLGFEHYDAVGVWRAEEAGRPVDARGELAQTDVNGPFTGAVELAQKLSSSRMVSDCAAARWFHFAYGRVETQEDACSIAQLKNSFATSSGSIIEQLVALTQTDTFLYRKSF